MPPRGLEAIEMRYAFWSALRVLECGSHLPLYVDDQRYPKAPEGWRSPGQTTSTVLHTQQNLTCLHHVSKIKDLSPRQGCYAT
jgi:hypothetical protein